MQKALGLGVVAFTLIACSSGPGPAGNDGGVTDDVYTPPWDGGSAYHAPAPVDLDCVATFSRETRLIAGVHLDPMGGIVVYGTLLADQDLDPGPALEPFVLTTLGHSESFVARFDSSCAYQWTRVLDAQLEATDVAVAETGEVVIAGRGEAGSIDFDPTDGADRRSDLDYPFVTRLRLDGSYIGTAGQDCFAGICTVGGAEPPSIAVGEHALAVAADGTAYVSDRQLFRFAPDGTEGWPAIAPDAGVPVGGTISVAPNGDVWASETLPVGDVDYGPGTDRVASICRAGDTTCADRQVLVRVHPDGTYGGSIATTFGFLSLPAPLFDDGTPDPFLAGIFFPGSLPDLDPGPGVDRRMPVSMEAVLYAQRLRLDGSEVWASVEAGSGDSTGGTPQVHLNEFALDRSEDLLYRVGTHGGLFIGLPIEQASGGGWILAQTLDGRYAWGAPSIGMGLDHVDARGGDLVVVGVVDDASDLDFTWDGRFPLTPAPTEATWAIALYHLERCTDGATMPAGCPDGSIGALSCSGGRWGTLQGCAAPSEVLGSRRQCLGCEDLNANGIACGTHDDGCGATLSCGTCPAPMVCGGTNRTCVGPSGSTVTLAEMLNHPIDALELDATHAYVLLANDYPPVDSGASSGPQSIVRVPLDGTGTVTTLFTGGPTLRFAVGATHVYVLDTAAGTASRVPKDGSGAPEVLASGLTNLGSIVADGSLYVYYTTELAAEPAHPRWLYQYDQGTQTLARADSLPFEPVSFMQDTTHLYVSESISGGRSWYRWTRGEVGIPSPIFTISTQDTIVAFDTASGVAYEADRNDGTLYRRPFLSGPTGRPSVMNYADLAMLPSPGIFDGNDLWWLEGGERSTSTWLGLVRHVDLTTGESVVAFSGLNHASAMARDASGFYVATEGDLTAHGTNGAIARIW